MVVSRVPSLGDAEAFCLGLWNRGGRRMQDKSLFLYVDAGFRIDRQCEIEGLRKRRLDLSDQAEPGPKLGMHGGPSDRR